MGTHKVAIVAGARTPFVKAGKHLPQSGLLRWRSMPWTGCSIGITSMRIGSTPSPLVQSGGRCSMSISVWQLVQQLLAPSNSRFGMSQLILLGL
jgi:hypothetical protein